MTRARYACIEIRWVIQRSRDVIKESRLLLEATDFELDRFNQIWSGCYKRE